MLKYIGKGNWLPNVPARDLTDEEVKKCGGEKYLISTGLYQAEKPKPEKKPKEKKEGE